MGEMVFMCLQRAEHMPISCAKGTKKFQIVKEKPRKVYKMIVCDISEMAEKCPKRAAEQMHGKSRGHADHARAGQQAEAHDRATRGRRTAC